MPFFLVETAALVEGTGERVTALGALPPWWIVLCVPPVAVETKNAFEWLDAARGDAYATRARAGSASLRAVEALQHGDFAAVAQAGANDFEAIVLSREPAIAAAFDALVAAGARLVRLTGSGSATFALAESRAEAEAIVARADPPRGSNLTVVPLVAGKGWRR